MNFGRAIRTAGLLLTLVLEAVAVEVPPSPPFPYALERSESAKGFSSFSLALGPVPGDLTLTATLILMREKKLAGRIPLRLYGKAETKLGLRCSAGCLSDDFVQRFVAESRIELYVQQVDDM